MRGVAVVLISVAILTACSKGKKSTPEAGSGLTPPGDTEWVAQKSELACAPGISCPPQVGVLLFVFPLRGNTYPIKKCTAFVIGQQRIASNGHCDYTGRAQGYFITAQPTRQVRKIIEVSAKAFTPSADGETESGRPDFAFFELDRPVGVRPLEFASVNDPLYDKLIGFVVNGTGNKFVIERVECAARRHESYFPFDLGENPDVLTIFGCATRKGNSGAPFFAAGSGKVEAINQGVSDPEAIARRVREVERRQPFNYERHWIVKATNARCLYAPKGACTVADHETANRRFVEMQRRAWAARRGQPFDFNEWAEVVPPRQIN